MERKSAEDAFARKTPWPGIREAARPSGRRLIILTALMLSSSIYWAVSALGSDGWHLIGAIAAAGGGVVLAAFNIREWIRGRNDVRVPW